MTDSNKFLVFSLVSAGVLAMSAQTAHALQMSVYKQQISQVGDTSGVSLGHAVSASTNMNRLYAVAGFDTRCVSSYTGSIIDQRGFGAESLIFGTSVTVTVPASLPAVRVMPGFDQVPGGTWLSCNYIWTADAEESTYSLGVGGIGITIGGQKAHEASSIPFTMYKPAPSGSDDDNGCIH